MEDKMKTKKAKEQEDNAKNQAASQLESIIEMVDALTAPGVVDDDTEQEAAREAIQEDPLEISVRSDWEHLGEPLKACEFNILLCTGGPACRILGELDEYNQPHRAWLEYQDWGTPWTQYFMSHEENVALLTYCQQFYFGE
jgi:hypothetical protein